jgi:hypothetical protein
MKTRHWVASTVIILFWTSSLPVTGEQRRPSYDLLRKLPEMPEQVSVHQFSSHNKKGLNGDENWPLYKDMHGDDVIFDASGPGCVKSMWATNLDPSAILKFYFDGEKKPRYSIPYMDFFMGRHPLFPPPLVSYERRGHWGSKPFAGNSFVPVPFEKSLKIAVQGESRFFHIIYVKYPYGFPIITFSGKEDRTGLVDSFDRAREESLVFDDRTASTAETDILEPGEEVILFHQKNECGLIRKIVLDADGSREFFQNTWIQMRWDGHTHWDIRAPVGIFFGSAVEADEMRSLPLQVEKEESGRVLLSCFFPMPYWSQAEIVWVNRSQQRIGPLKAHILIDRNPYEMERGAYFITLYRAGKTTYSRDWLLFESPGTGWFVGVVQSMRNAHYCEGDEHFTIDGALSPQINGTGSEDYYLACFWPNLDFDTPFGCVVGDIQKKGGGEMVGAYHVPSCYSRFHLEAPIPFYSSIDARIQHGGLSHVFSDYRSLAFCYLRKQPAMRQSDFCDVGNPASESSHHYSATRSDSITRLKSFPEGSYFLYPSEEKGRCHNGGEISFKIAIDSENRGVRLRRLLDQGIPRQKAHVYIDGKYAGCWYHGYHNEHLRWCESDFDIHPNYTAGKGILDVRLVVENGNEHGKFSDFYYKVYSFYH